MDLQLSRFSDLAVIISIVYPSNYGILSKRQVLVIETIEVKGNLYLPLLLFHAENTGWIQCL